VSSQAGSQRTVSRGPSIGVTEVVGLALVALVILWLAINLGKAPGEFFQDFLIGLTQGAIYGLVALGYTLVYGILELINFAHGDVFMLGGMFTITYAVDIFDLHSGQGWEIVPIRVMAIMPPSMNTSPWAKLISSRIP
jgi:ABC-type branched-subunit amino acid transport system permease subunit